MSSVTRTAVVVQNPRTARRRDRFAAQRVLWRESKHKRVRACGQHASANSDGVQLRVTHTDAGATAGFAGLQTCGSVWSCPVCSARILSTRQQEIADAVDRWAETGGQVAMMTFTMRHDASDNLADLWAALSEGWHGITAGKVHQAEKEVYGIATTRVVASGKRAGQTVPTHVLPWLRVVEVTHGYNGWHVHVHAIVFLGADVERADLEALYATWWKRWNSGLESSGVDGSLMVNTVETFVGRDVSKRVGAYVTKNTYTAGQVAGLEAARSDLKTGRFGNRSPFEILRDLVLQPNGPDTVERDAALWAVFELASHKKRQMTWARGARKVLGLDVVEQTDEEIAAEELGSADDAVLNIPVDSWKAMNRISGRRADLLDLAEQPGVTLLDLGALLDEWGTEWIKAGLRDL